MKRILGKEGSIIEKTGFQQRKSVEIPFFRYLLLVVGFRLFVPAHAPRKDKIGTAECSSVETRGE